MFILSKALKKNHNSAFASEPIVPSSAYFTQACRPRFTEKPPGWSHVKELRRETVSEEKRKKRQKGKNEVHESLRGQKREREREEAVGGVERLCLFVFCCFLCF